MAPASAPVQFKPERAVDEQLSKEDLEELSTMSTDDLFLLLGIEAYRAGIITTIRGLVTPKKLIEAAKRLLSDWNEYLRTKVCDEWNYCAKKEKYVDNTELAHALVIGAGVLIPGLPLAAGWSISFILIKRSLDSFCHCKKGSDQQRETPSQKEEESSRPRPRVRPKSSGTFYFDKAEDSKKTTPRDRTSH